MTISPIIIIGIAVVVAVGVIIWGIISVRSEKDIIEERLARIENANTVFPRTGRSDPKTSPPKRRRAPFRIGSTASFPSEASAKNGVSSFPAPTSS